MEKWIYNIQSLRGFAALSVLFFHVMLMEKKWGSGNLILPRLLDLGASGVDLFFVISGFMMVTVTRGKFQQKGAIKQFAYNRISRIYPLYWFYSSILLCVFVIKPEVINPSMLNQVNILESFLLLPQNICPLLMVGWPLVHEMYFYIVFTLILMTPEKHLLKFLLFWALACISVHMIMSDFPKLSFNPYIKIIFNPLTLEFIAGCLTAILIFKGTTKYGLISLIIGICILVIVGIFYHAYPSIPIFNSQLRIILFGLPYSLAVYGAVAIETGKGKSFSVLLRKIGDQSYSLYLSHTIVINGIGWLWAYNTIPAFEYNVIWILLMPLFSIITGYYSFKLLEKPLIAAAKNFSKKLLPQKIG